MFVGDCRIMNDTKATCQSDSTFSISCLVAYLGAFDVKPNDLKEEPVPLSPYA